MEHDPDTPETDGLDEQDYRRIVRSRFTEVEIDLILELVSRLPVGVWAASGEEQEFAVRLWSPGAERLYGLSKDEVLGQNYIDKFVNRLERRQAILDHRTVETARQPYRNLARDRRGDQTARLMLTQGVALWHPVLRHYLQGEITVDATDVPGKDRNWLEQVLTPEAMRRLLDHFTEMTQAAFVSVDKVTLVAATLIKVFLGESAESLFFLERPGTELAAAGSRSAATNCEFDPKAVVRWVMGTTESTLLVDYGDRRPPVRSVGGHAVAFPRPLNKVAKQAPFAVSVVRDDISGARGGVFVYLAPGETLSELTDGILAAVCGTVKLALAIEEKVAQAQREGSLAAKERERQATLRLARQYRHAVVKKANVLDIYAGLIEEKMTSEKLSTAAVALRAVAQYLRGTGQSFETDLREKEFSLTDVLNSVTGSIMHEYPQIRLSRANFPEVVMKGIRPFIEGAFENLLLNAIEAQSYQGAVGVDCSAVHRGRTSSTIDVCVCDSGGGMPMEVQEKVNDGQQITTKGEGRGLGLVIARLSIEECGGELSLLPRPRPGWQGACFQVRLPVSRPPRRKN